MRGVDLVDRTGAALSRITGEVQSVADLAQGLASAISNQSAGLNEISLGLSQLDQVTQQNAGMVEQTAHTQASLHAEAESLGSAIARFQVGCDRGATGGQTAQYDATGELPVRLAS
jgi:methyl-accepting chemotaxis protein